MPIDLLKIDEVLTTAKSDRKRGSIMPILLAIFGGLIQILSLWKQLTNGKLAETLRKWTIRGAVSVREYLGKPDLNMLEISKCYRDFR